MHRTYILYSTSIDKYYIGHTSDINKRLISHNKGSNTFTKRGIPWVVVFSKEFSTKSEAIKYELYIKNMKSRDYIEKLITSG